ncbi:hypothetical protein PQX77_007766 [Marasmius sp. AFHP31]|nr:hypothetical protein PQX77_007766 [Marasmius sp. AFHP31]
MHLPIVLEIGYGYYHFSGIKQAVETAKNVKVYLEQTRESVLKKHPNEAVEYLRKVAKTYGALVPGSGRVIDRVFNAVEEVVEEHQEEASEIMLQAQVEIQEVMKRKKEISNVELASEVMNVLSVHLAAIVALGSKAGGKLADPLWVHLPDMTPARDKVAESVGAIKGLTSRVWPRSSKNDTDHPDTKELDEK